MESADWPRRQRHLAVNHDVAFKLYKSRPFTASFLLVFVSRDVLPEAISQRFEFPDSNFCKLLNTNHLTYRFRHVFSEFHSFRVNFGYLQVNFSEITKLSVVKVISSVIEILQANFSATADNLQCCYQGHHRLRIRN